MKRWILVWLLPLLACCDRVLRHNKDLDQSPVRGDIPDQHDTGGTECLSTDCMIEDLHTSCVVSGPKRGLADAKRCMAHVNMIMDGRKPDIDFEAIERLENSLEQTEVKESTSMRVGRLTALLLKPGGRLPGLHISASDSEANAGTPVNNSRVNVHLPGDLLPSLDDTLLFCMVTWPRSIWLQNVTSEELYQNRLLGLRLHGKTVSGLRQRVNITVNAVTINLKADIQKSGSRKNSDNTMESGNSPLYCESTFLWLLLLPTKSDAFPSFFSIRVPWKLAKLVAVFPLQVSAPLSDANEAVLSYLSLIGCTLSLVTLVMTLLLFVTKRKLREDVSMKVHANLAVALILLNAHFLSSRAAALSSDGLCFYVALALHYSLLATFSWMALESFHLYLLLVRVFNIYIRRYMLKLGLAGWSLPAAIVILAVFLKPDAYGRVALDATDPESTQICYLLDGTLKMVSTLGVFSVVFAFNLVMLVVTVQRLTGLPHSKRPQVGQGERGRTKQNISTLLGVSTLLGITWGLVFFSFGHLSTAGLYLFCILNSLQGFFIFLWFVLSWRKSAPSTASSKTPSASS
ncbi:adhesion G-protein coupled receptor G5-like [Hippocampus comes]|uniref:adhesion G-protein coupled receptor G5-like n=1 Tax=Hippocampus comes TaxID=109280 RepID=UPI00094EEEA1|nr:PREDICTED: adhesion G-protein coupled receptor G5-like [Hippocampus comes]